MLIFKLGYRCAPKNRSRRDTARVIVSLVFSVDDVRSGRYAAAAPRFISQHGMCGLCLLKLCSGRVSPGALLARLILLEIPRLVCSRGGSRGAGSLTREWPRSWAGSKPKNERPKDNRADRRRLRDLLPCTGLAVFVLRLVDSLESFWLVKKIVVHDEGPKQANHLNRISAATLIQMPCGRGDELERLHGSLHISLLQTSLKSHQSITELPAKNGHPKS